MMPGLILPINFLKSIPSWYLPCWLAWLVIMIIIKTISIFTMLAGVEASELLFSLSSHSFAFTVCFRVSKDIPGWGGEASKQIQNTKYQAWGYRKMHKHANWVWSQIKGVRNKSPNINGDTPSKRFPRDIKTDKTSNDRCDSSSNFIFPSDWISMIFGQSVITKVKWDRIHGMSQVGLCFSTVSFQMSP